MTTWTVTRGGVSHLLQISEAGLELSGSTSGSAAWENITAIEFPTSFSAVIIGADTWTLGFASRHDRADFERALDAKPGGEATTTAVTTSPVERRAASRAVRLMTTPTYPGRESFEVLDMVSSSVVMSRNTFSDFGSDVKSVIGGNLVGVEKAMLRGVAEAETRLRDEALAHRADAVIAITVAIASVSDKAQAIVMTGTAIRFSETAAPPT